MAELSPRVGPFIRTLGLGGPLGTQLTEWCHTQEQSSVGYLDFPKLQGCLSHTWTSPSLFKMWTRLRSKAAGAGLKGAAGALETLGCQNQCTEEAIPGAPGRRLICWASLLS